MARYIGPTCKLARREGSDLGLKSPARAIDSKCKLENKPGQHGVAGARKGKLSDYATQLREKQKLKRIYGMLERQFRSYYSKAARRKGNTGDTLLQLLEMRLDNVVYRLGLAPTRRAARQMVSHGHITINGRKTTIPSRAVHIGEVVGVREGSKTRVLFENFAEKFAERTLSSWLTWDAKSMQGGVQQVPTTESADPAGDLAGGARERAGQ